jgi:hypothetical protein
MRAPIPYIRAPVKKQDRKNVRRQSSAVRRSSGLRNAKTEFSIASSQIKDILDQYDVRPTPNFQEEARHDQSFLTPLDLLAAAPEHLPVPGHA